MEEKGLNKEKTHLAMETNKKISENEYYDKKVSNSEKNNEASNSKEDSVADSNESIENNNKKTPTKKYKIVIVFSIMTLLLSLCNISYAGLFGGDDLTTKITKGLSQIQGWILKVATPAAAVSIGFGLLMKKFSFGDEEKITVGKKLIRSTLFSYAFILLIDPIISAIQTLFA